MKPGLGLAPALHHLLADVLLACLLASACILVFWLTVVYIKTRNRRLVASRDVCYNRRMNTKRTEVKR